MLGNGRQQPWTTKTFWYAGIVCALFSVLTAAQQSMRLHRLCAHRDGLQRIRNCMMHPEVDKDGFYRPRRWRVYTWQISPMLLALSVLCMITGMGVMIWVGAGLGPLKKEYEEWWDSNAKVGPFALHAGSILTPRRWQCRGPLFSCLLLGPSFSRSLDWPKGNLVKRSIRSMREFFRWSSLAEQFSSRTFSGLKRMSWTRHHDGVYIHWKSAYALMTILLTTSFHMQNV